MPVRNQSVDSLQGQICFLIRHFRVIVAGRYGESEVYLETTAPKID